MKVLISATDKQYWTKGDVHTKFGHLKEEQLQKDMVKTNTGKKYRVLPAHLLDKLEQIKRGPAMMRVKDIGQILSNLPLAKSSTVIEAGTGNGFLTMHLARYVKTVYSYEQRKDFFDLASENIKQIGMKNIRLRNKPVQDASEKVNAIILDIPNPWEIVPLSEQVLYKPGYLVAYLPNITQVQHLIKRAKPLFVEKILEVIEREWEIHDRITKPKHLIVGHTAWLVFLRT